MKIAIFMGNSFWPSIPYDGLNLYKYIKEKSDYNIDLIMFKDDIRLKGKNGKSNKFNFDTKYFINENKIIVNNWDEFFSQSNNYKLLIMSAQIINKFNNSNLPVWNNLIFSRFAHNFKKHIKCKVALWDIGGADLLCWYNYFGDYFFTKCKMFSLWLEKMGAHKDCIFTTGSPHFDYFIENLSFKLYSNFLTKNEFLKKYNINNNKKNILIFPSNLKGARHMKQHKSSMVFFKKLYNSYQSKYNFLIKTHPRDYLYYEDEKQYNAVQRRATENKPYYSIFKDNFPKAIVIEAQDHFNSIKHSDIFLNNAGSSTTWEIFAFTKKKSYSINFKTQPYYKGVSYLPDYVIYPDDIVNIEISEPEQLQEPQNNIEKYHNIIKEYVLDEFSLPNILKSINIILNT